MFNNLDPIWLFLGGVALRYGGDLLKIAITYGRLRQRIWTSGISLSGNDC